MTLYVRDALERSLDEQALTAVPTYHALQSDIETSREKTVTAYSAQDYRAEVGEYADAVPMASVVAVVTPGGRLGSGFYVREDLVLTNQHVIDGAKYVEIKKFGGEESFGKVLAQDIRRDLALVKVEAHGEPVEWYSRRSVPLGATVLAVGHPRGMMFSLTRGALSGTRRIATVTGGEAGGRILTIQTDAAINPGNSGGPLFLNRRVIGVNTEKLGDSEGLGFAVHYGEVQQFLEREGVISISLHTTHGPDAS